ncbi:hypothetical protein [Patiriisocius marinus]|uniref:Uncharacterized protein n=1 Tax=Patiriisocius marinus TaxID=1397112 RepID=A0A5J4IYV2_9FLAO|nr:hypothetical protein [Patiriisocius marinus]GER58818.1 hypothetical protein ULMA_09260 [Patiriisocius marinus]
MEQTLPFVKFFKSAAILIVVTIYFIAPLQQPLAEGFHKVAHAFSKTSNHHSHISNLLEKDHEDHAHSHSTQQHETHSHEFLSFLNTVFSNDIEDDQHPSLNTELDKHVIKLAFFEPKFHKVKSRTQFYWVNKQYIVSTAIASPPPKEIA